MIFLVATDFKPSEEETVVYWCSLEKLFWNFPKLCSNTPVQWFIYFFFFLKKEGLLSTILSKRRHQNWHFSVSFAKHTSRQLFLCLKHRINRLEMLIIPNTFEVVVCTIKYRYINICFNYKKTTFYVSKILGTFVTFYFLIGMLFPL